MKILVAGDFCPTGRLVKILEEKKYQFLFHGVDEIVKSVDYAIVNYECPVVLDKYDSIEKCGPNLSSTSVGIEAVKYAGFSIATLANNHIMDFGESGLRDTIITCQKYGIDTVGAGKTVSDASKILYKTKDGFSLAIINCCEHEFSIATDNSAGANPLNPVNQYCKIKEAKLHADYVLVIVHGGHEHYQLPSPRMVETYRFFIDAGADAVVNHHQHCFSGYEVYKGKPICYGLGNFCFDNPGKRNSIWNEGYMLVLETGGAFEIIPYIQNDSEVGVRLLESNAFSERISFLNAIICDDRKLRSEFDSLVSDREIFNEFLFEPYQSRILKKMFYRKWIPKVFPRIKKVLFENIVCCESHRDILISYLKHINKSNL